MSVQVAKSKQGARAKADRAGLGQPLLFENVSQSAIAYLLASQDDGRTKLTVTATDEAAELLAADLRALGCDDVGVLTSDDHTPFSEVASSVQAAQDRLV